MELVIQTLICRNTESSRISTVTLLLSKFPQGSRYQNSQERDELLPVEGCATEKTAIGIHGSSMVVML